MAENKGATHRWKPGQSGNPAGISATVQEARALARNASTKAIRKLIRLMDCEDERVAYMAVTAVLDRGIGKPKEDDGSADKDPAGKIDVTKLSAEDRSKLRELVEKAAAYPQVEAPPEPEEEDMPALPAPGVIDGEATEVTE